MHKPKDKYQMSPVIITDEVRLTGDNIELVNNPVDTKQIHAERLISRPFQPDLKGNTIPIPISVPESWSKGVKMDDKFRIPPVVFTDEVRLTGDNLKFENIVRDIKTSGIISMPGVSGAGVITVDSMPESIRDLPIGAKITDRYGNQGRNPFINPPEEEPSIASGIDIIDNAFRDGIQLGVIGGGRMPSTVAKMFELAETAHSESLTYVENESMPADVERALKERTIMIDGSPSVMPEFLAQKIQASSMYGGLGDSMPNMNRKQRRAFDKQMRKTKPRR